MLFLSGGIATLPTCCGTHAGEFVLIDQQQDYSARSASGGRGQHFRRDADTNRVYSDADTLELLVCTTSITASNEMLKYIPYDYHEPDNDQIAKLPVHTIQTSCGCQEFFYSDM